MGLESASYISSLNVANPSAQDALSQADDHLRLIKTAVLQSFPNINSAVTATPAVLNTVTAMTSDGSTPSLNTGITGAEVKTLIGVVEPAIAISGSTVSLDSGTDASAVWSLLKTEAFKTIYPVGAIYTSITATDPGTLFGGTWTAFGAGRVLVGLSSSDGDFDTVEATGGNKTHTLTVDEMPAHTHDILYQELDDVGVTTHPAGTQPGDPTATIATQSTGGGQAHSILQPYIVVYMWKRTQL
tara:strand:+ start:15359 stop:16087 length:729 start_codon:yes stop_codon:yes gene_type:complete